jgi:hypothetical protein
MHAPSALATSLSSPQDLHHVGCTPTAVARADVMIARAPSRLPSRSFVVHTLDGDQLDGVQIGYVTIPSAPTKAWYV